MLRNIAKVAKPEVTVVVEGKKITLTSVSAVKTMVVSGVLDEEVDETTADGRKVKVSDTAAAVAAAAEL